MRENSPATPTKVAKEALVILDKCPKISPVKVKCQGGRIMIESMSSSTESDDNEHSFEIKSKKFRCITTSKEKANAFALLKSPQTGMENSTKMKTGVKQKKEKSERGKKEKGKKENKKKKDDGKDDSSIKNEQKKMDNIEIKLINIDESPSKPGSKIPEKKNEKKREKMEQKQNGNEKCKENKTEEQSKSKVKSKDSGLKKSSKKSQGTSEANKAVKKLLTEKDTKTRENDSSSVIILEDSQDTPDTNTVSLLKHLHV